MIPLTKDAKIFVVCPAYTKTGGTELLHQLVYELNQNHINAQIAYCNTADNKEYTADDFKQYIHDFELYENVQDDENNYLIFPEVMAKEVQRFLKAKKIIWWLSVDNYLHRPGIVNTIKHYGIKGTINALKLYRPQHVLRLFLASHAHNNEDDNNNLSLADYHLCQSYYALDFLESKGFKNNVFYLSDYINDSFFQDKIDQGKERKKENRVLYNPKKGFRFTKKLIRKTPDLNWTPIENLTTSQVGDLLRSSKVYIDFGNHPGKDRFPREAAICGCCIITGKKGAAKFTKDTPLPKQYKFDDDTKNLDDIIASIRHCLANYDEEIVKFADYQKYIADEKNLFHQDVKNVFCASQK